MDFITDGYFHVYFHTNCGIENIRYAATPLSWHSSCP